MTRLPGAPDDYAPGRPTASAAIRIAERREHVRSRRADGATLAEFEAETGVSQAAIWKDIKRLGIAGRNGTSRSEIGKRNLTPLRKQAEALVAAFAEEHGYLTQAQAATELRVTASNLIRYEELGLITATRRAFGDARKPYALYAKRDVLRLRRTLWKAWRAAVGSDLQRGADLRDPAQMYDYWRGRGAPVARAKALRRRVEERNERDKLLRIDKPQPAPMRAHHVRWKRMLDEIVDEVPEHERPYGYDHADQRALTRQDILRQIFLDDWQTHPDAWPRGSWPPDRSDVESPAVDLFRRACHRIDVAVKALQNV